MNRSPGPSRGAISGIARSSAFLAAAGAAGAALVLLRGAGYGVALDVDSAAYISTARRLLEGAGFLKWDDAPYIDSPPLLPLALALPGLFGVDAVEAARYVNAAAFGATVAAAGAWLRTRLRSDGILLWAVCACALSPPLARAAAGADSEPLFVLFVVLSLFALDRYLDDGRARLLAAAAACAALACLARYPGVALVACALPLLLARRGAGPWARLADAAAFAAAALAPLGLWLARNFAISGSLAGENYPTGFSTPGALAAAADEFVRWTAGESALAAIDAALDGPSGAAAKLAILAVPAALAAFALARDRRGVAVPAMFIAAYAALLAVSLPLTDIQLYFRFLAPFYAPALVAAAVALDALLRGAGERPPPNRRGAAVLAACLVLWLAQQADTTRAHIEDRVRDGYGYASGYWSESAVVRYAGAHPFDGCVWSTEARALYLLAGVPAAGRLRELPPSLPAGEGGGTEWWTDWAGVACPNVYFVWFSRDRGRHLRYEYGPEALAALPGVETVATLPDGEIFVAGGGAGGVPAFDVALDEDGGGITYRRDGCGEGDVESRFHLHVYPADREHLPEERRSAGFEKLDFDFPEYGALDGASCAVERPLPDYAVREIQVGQYERATGKAVWRKTLLPAGAPGFEVEFDEDGGGVTYRMEDCGADDVGPRFGLHVYPVDVRDLPEERRFAGFEKLDFDFLDYGSVAGASCAVERPLPDYAVREIQVGQYERATGKAVWRKTLLPAGAPGFEVEFDEDGGGVTYRMEDCGADDVGPRFGLHVYPVDVRDLPEERRSAGWDNLDFDFPEYGALDGASCAIERPLPDYAVREIRTGQYERDTGEAVWEKALLPAGASGFEVALDEDGSRVTYRMEDCEPGDVEGVFYLHVYPVDARDLPEGRRSVGFDNLDFRFRDYGVARGGLCVAERALPDYGVRAVQTGRYDDRSGEMAWERSLGLAGSSGFEVSLDEDGGKVVFRADDCRPADIGRRFLFRAYPVDPADLPAGRRAAGFDDLDFDFSDYGVLRGASCVVERPLPGYRAMRVWTGQYDIGTGRVKWERSLGLAGTSGFEVALDEDGGKAIYRADDCGPADIGHRFLFRVYPVDPADLPAGRRAAGFDDLDFDFSDYGVLRGASCVVERPLPGYRAMRVWTGQYDIGTGRVKWERSLGLAGTSGFEVALDEDGGKAIYRADDCGPADIGHRFLFRVYPVDPADLPAGRRAAGFDDLDFDFSDYGVLRGASCVVERPLPGYRVEAVRTGQHERATGEPVWGRWLRPDGRGGG